MGSSYDRRDFLRALAAAGAGLSMSRAAAAQQTAAQLAVVPMSTTLFLITGAGANVLMVTGPDGVALVDGGLPERSADLLALVAERSGGGRVRILFNTHWHSDHTGSNEALGMAGARIIAHQNTRRWLSSQVFSEGQNRTFPPRPPHAIPAETITRTARITLGSEAIEYGPLPPAHTNGTSTCSSPPPTSWR